MDKQNVVYPYNGILFSQVLTHAVTLTNVENIMLSMKEHTKSHILYDSIYMKCPAQANPQRQKED